DPDLIQDLNVLRDPRTGALPAPLRAMLRTAADARRTTMRATVHRIAAEERTTGRPPSGRAPGRAPGRAQVAPRPSQPLPLSRPRPARTPSGRAPGRAPGRAQVAP